MKRIVILFTALCVLCSMCTGLCEKNAEEPLSYAGVWAHDRVEMVIERDDGAQGYDTDVYTVQIFWGSGAFEMTEWLYRNVWYDDVSDALICEGQGLKMNILLPDSDGADAAETVETEYEDGSARFYYDAESKLVWEDYKEAPGTALDFERMEALNQSALFTDDDFGAALELILTAFSDFEGCELHSLYFAGDAYSTAESAAWLSELAKAQGYNGTVTQAMLFLSDFHSPTDPAARTSLDIDAEYTDWQWWLGRSESGEWLLLSWGY